MNLYDELEESFKTALVAAGVSYDGSVHFEHPESLIHGDITTNCALALAKQSQMNPRALAEKIVSVLQKPASVASVSVAGPGFINITLIDSFFSTSLQEILELKSSWGAAERSSDEVVVEYTDPNPFKAFHIGHLMSNAIGESLSRIFAFQGMRVRRANYQGDVGIHIACALWGVQQLGVSIDDGSELGRAYSHGAKAYKEDENAKQEINAINKSVYDKSDPILNDLYARGRSASLALFETIYKTLGTKFDRYFFESELAEKGKAIVLNHPKVFEDSDGAKVYKGEKVGLHTRVFLSAQGLPIYETKELALAYEKQVVFPNATKFYVVTANEITEYYKVVVAAMKEIDATLAEKMHHVPHGMMRLPEGKMSSRTGNVITGESLIHDLTTAALTRAKESRAEDPQLLASQIAVAAIKFQVLRQGIGKDIIFEQEKALSLEGDTGPYIQYAFARCVSLLQKGRDVGVTPSVSNLPPSTIERLLYRFPEIVTRSALELAPHHVAHFALEITHAFNAWYAGEQIIGSEHAAHKLAVVEAVMQTLRNSLHLLGISAPEQM